MATWNIAERIEVDRLIESARELVREARDGWRAPKGRLSDWFLAELAINPVIAYERRHVQAMAAELRKARAAVARLAEALGEGE